MTKEVTHRVIYYLLKRICYPITEAFKRDHLTCREKNNSVCWRPTRYDFFIQPHP